MKSYSRTRVLDQILLNDFAERCVRDCGNTADLLADLGEIDFRKLYLPAAHPSMFSYCVHERRMSEDVAFKRIRVARAARRFPGIFYAVADGRLNLSGVVLLAPFLTEGTAVELLAAAEHKTNAGIAQLLAERFPRPDVPTVVKAISPPTLSVEQLLVGSEQPCQLAVQPVEMSSDGLAMQPVENSACQLAVRPVETSACQLAVRPVETPAPRPKLTPLAPQRYAIQFTIGQDAHDMLKHAQALLGHQVPSGDIAAVFERALRSLIVELEKRKFAATETPRKIRTRAATANPRHIPAYVRRAVRKRDGRQCTFLSKAGHRCPARTNLEFDHVQEVARGGRATVAGIRLRCRAHNQYTAECTFGSEFMNYKRDQARRARAKDRAKPAAVASSAFGLRPEITTRRPNLSGAPS